MEYLNMTTADLTEMVEAVLNPIVVLGDLKKAIELLESHREAILPLAMSEAEKHPKGAGEVQGVTFAIAEVGTRYDYSKCGHPEYAKHKQAVADIEAELKAMRESKTIIVEDTGEVIKIYPPVKKSSTSLKISFKK